MTDRRLKVKMSSMILHLKKQIGTAAANLAAKQG